MATRPVLRYRTTGEPIEERQRCLVWYDDHSGTIGWFEATVESIRTLTVKLRYTADDSAESPTYADTIRRTIPWQQTAPEGPPPAYAAASPDGQSRDVHGALPGAQQDGGTQRAPAAVGAPANTAAGALLLLLIASGARRPPNRRADGITVDGRLLTIGDGVWSETHGAAATIVRIDATVTIRFPTGLNEIIPRRDANMRLTALPAHRPAPQPLHLPGDDAPLTQGRRVWVFSGFTSVWERATILATDGDVTVSYATDGATEHIDFEEAPARITHQQPGWRLADFQSNAADRRRRADRNAELASRRANNPTTPATASFAYLDNHKHVTPTTLIFLEMFCGPYHSMQMAATEFAGTAACAVDWDARFAPTVLADITYWNPWTWCIAHLSFDKGTKVLLPGYIHFSPTCTAFGAASPLHGCALGQAFLSAIALGSIWAVRAMCRWIRQLADFPTVVSVENPEDSKMWQHACVKALLDSGILTKNPVSYCMYGANFQKNTCIACSPALGRRWARRCDGSSGKCGLMQLQADGSKTHRGKDGGFSIVDARIPPGLTHGLVMAWREHHGPILLDRDTTNSYVITMEHAVRLQHQWAQQLAADLQ